MQLFTLLKVFHFNQVDMEANQLYMNFLVPVPVQHLLQLEHIYYRFPSSCSCVASTVARTYILPFSQFLFLCSIYCSQNIYVTVFLVPVPVQHLLQLEHIYITVFLVPVPVQHLQQLEHEEPQPLLILLPLLKKGNCALYSNTC